MNAARLIWWDMQTPGLAWPLGEPLLELRCVLATGRDGEVQQTRGAMAARRNSSRHGRTLCRPCQQHESCASWSAQPSKCGSNRSGPVLSAQREGGSPGSVLSEPHLTEAIAAAQLAPRSDAPNHTLPFILPTKVPPRKQASVAKCPSHRQSPSGLRRSQRYLGRFGCE